MGCYHLPTFRRGLELVSAKSGEIVVLPSHRTGREISFETMKCAVCELFHEKDQ